jgi:large subunit ribosomal protein L41
MKPTHALFRRIRRLALTTKQTNKGFYKGTGSGSTGRHTQHGGYIIEWPKVRTYVVPKNLKDFKARNRPFYPATKYPHLY